MSTIYAEADISLPNDTDVVVRRSFNAPRDLVWRAYTEPALVQRWMLGYPGWTMPVCEMDVRVGGKFRWRWRRDEDGVQFGFHGEFREVNAPARLANTEFFDPGDIGGDMGSGADITTDFAEHGGVTTLTIVISYKSKAEREAALSTGMTDGMEASYQGLDRLLTERLLGPATVRRY
ncbi:MAG TPA: SRPBCC family protein [Caulobacterales bacterium]|nr:SRPBCC family protein [Caulobacterales bacterium]